jgi:uncharacterized RDD family membrane protein YckC
MVTDLMSKNTCSNHPDIIAGLETCSTCKRVFCENCIISLAGKSICATCKEGNLRDIIANTPTDIQYASRGSRFTAQLIDNGVFLIYLIIVFFCFMNLAIARQMEGWMLIASMFGPIAYEGILLSYGGRTFGKMLMGIQVVNTRGSRLSAWRCWLRALIRIIALVTRLLSLVDALMIFSSKRRCLHDLVAGSMVIRNESRYVKRQRRRLVKAPLVGAKISSTTDKAASDSDR